MFKRKIISFAMILMLLLSLFGGVSAQEDKVFTVTFSSPHNNEYGVSPVNLKVLVEFSEDVDASTLTASNVEVSDGALGCVVASDTNKAVIYLERGEVALGHTYTVTLKSSIKSVSGLPLQEEGISFTVSSKAPEYRQISNSDMSDIYYNGAFDGDYLGGDFLGGYIYLDGNPALKYVPAWDGASARQRVYIEGGKTYTARARVKSDTAQNIRFALTYNIPDVEEWFHQGKEVRVEQGQWTDITCSWDVPPNALTDKNVLYIVSEKKGSTVFVDDWQFYSFFNDVDEPDVDLGDKFTIVSEEDNSFEKMKALGVFAPGIEPDVKITRIDLAGAVLRFLGISNVGISDSAIDYEDVEDKDAPVVFLAEKLGIMNGVSEKSFAPYAGAEFGDVAEAMVKAMGYSPAVKSGNYELKAYETGIFDNIEYKDGDPVPASVLADIMNNALECNVLSPKKYSPDGNISYGKSGNALEECLRLRKTMGVIESTDKVSLTGETFLRKNRVLIGGKEYLCSTDLSGYVGCTVEIYYREKANYSTLLYVGAINRLNKTIEMDTFDNYLEYSGGVYRYTKGNEKEKRYNLSENRRVIYNGKYISNPPENLYAPQYGYVILRGDNKDFDTVIINDIRTITADAIDTTAMAVYSSSLTHPLKLSDGDVYIYDKFGFERDISFIRPGDILSVMQSRDLSVTKIYVSQDVQSCTITGITEENRNTVLLTDAGSTYVTIPSVMDAENIYPGTKGKLYTDYRGRAACFKPSGNGKNVGYLVDAATEGVLKKNILFKIFSQNGEMLYLEGAEKIKIDRTNCKDTESVIEALSKGTGEVISQLVVYNTNDEGKITFVDTAYNKLPDCMDYRTVVPEAPDDPDGFRVTYSSILPPNESPKELVYYMSSRSFDNKVYLASSPKIFVVPLSSKTDDEDKYNILPSYWSLGYGYTNCIEAYSLNADSFETEYLVIYIKESRWQINAKAGDNFGIVKDVRRVSHNDEIMHRITFTDGTVCYTDKDEWLAGAGNGDYVCYRSDKNGKFIRAALVFFDAPTRTIYVGNPYGSISDSDRMIFAHVYERRGSVVKVVLPDVNIEDEADVSVNHSIIDLSKADIYRYNREIDKVEKATISDVLDYVKSGSDYSGLLMVTDEGGAEHVLITEKR